MQKLLISFSLLLFSITHLSAQVDVTWGATLESETRMSKIIGEDADANVYTLMYKSKKWYLAKFASGTLDEKFSKQIILPDIDGKDQDFAQIYFMNDRLMILGSQYNNKTEHLKVTAYSCSLSGIMEKKGVTLLDVAAETRSKSGTVWYKQSPDNSKMLIANVSYDKQSNNYINIKVFDKNLKEVNTYKETVKGRVSNGMVKISVGGFILNNSGRMFYSYEKMYYKSGGIDFGDNTNNDRDYSIMEIDESGKKREIPIELKNLKVAAMAFITDKDNNLQVGGLYYQKQSKGFIKGIWVRGSFYVKLDGKTGKKLAETSKPFDKEMMLQFRKEKDLDKGKYLDNNFKLKSVYAKPDGGLFMVAEYFKVTQSEGGYMTTITYNYGPLIAIDITKTGDINWTRSIIKAQIYQQQMLNLGAALGGLYFTVGLPMTNDKTIYYSYMADVQGDEFVLIYNDNPSNLSPDLPPKKHKTLTNPKKGVPMLVTFDKDGNMKKKLLKDVLNGEEIYLRPQTYYYNEATDSYIIYGSKGLDDKLGRMKIDR